MPKGDSITLRTSSQFGVGSLATWKNQWIREHCWRRNIAYAYNEEIGYNFLYKFDFNSMLDQLDDIGAACYPNFRIKVTDGFNPTSIHADLQSIISEGKFEYIIDNTYTNDTFKIAAEFKSDLFLFSEASDYSEYLYGLRGTVGVSGGSNQPYYQQVVPLNSAPYFDDDVPVRMSVEQGGAFNFTLPTVTDEDEDNWNITLGKEDADFLLYDIDTNSLYIEEGASNSTEIGSKRITIFLTDDFPYGPETTEYSFELKVVERGEPTYIDKPVEPPLIQIVPETTISLFSVAAQVPVASIEKLTNSGLLQIRISKPIVDFPDDLMSLVNRNAKGYVEKDGVTEPDMNAEPWISPLITLKIISSDDSLARNLYFTWKMESYSETLLELRLNFTTPIKVSQNMQPEKLYIELQI